MTCVRSCQKPPLSLTETPSASPNTDLQLAKAEPISDTGRTSVRAKIYLRLKKKKICTAAFEKGMRIWERNSSSDTMVKKEREEVL